jgi:hypothetical protein
VIPTEDAPAPPAAKARKLPPGPTVALDALRKAIELHGERVPTTSVIPPNTKAVRDEQWQTAYNALRPLPEGAPAAEAKRDAHARRTAFRRAQEALQAGRHVGTWNGHWWIN